MAKPTPKERIIASLNFEEPDIVPYDVVIEPEVEDRLNEHYGGPHWEGMIQKHLTLACYPNWAQMEPVGEKYIRDEYGCGWDMTLTKQEKGVSSERIRQMQSPVVIERLSYSLSC